jgi:hypothetical protein
MATNVFLVLNAGSGTGECIYVYLQCIETLKFHIRYADSRFLGAFRKTEKNGY